MPKALSSEKGYKEKHQCAAQITQVDSHRVSNEHLNAENTAYPPIYSVPMSTRLNDLRNEVFRCLTQRPRAVVDDFGFQKSEILR